MSVGSTVKQYPTGIDQFITWQDDVDTIIASAVNDLHDQVIAIETELGTNPAGSETDVKTRLAASLNNDGTVKDDVIKDAAIDLGTAANQVNHSTFGFQKKTVTVTDASGEYSFDFTDEGLSDYGSISYQIFLCPTGTNIDVWAVVSGSKTTTGFTIKLLQPGTNGSSAYDPTSQGNVDVDVITLHSV